MKTSKLDLKCVLCDDLSKTQKQFNEHLEIHLVEMRKMEPANLQNEHGTFKCKVCDFKLQNKNAVMNHLPDHINDSLPADADYSDDDEIGNSEQGKAKTKADNIMDRLDQNGKPLFSDSDSESETT